MKKIIKVRGPSQVFEIHPKALSAFKLHANLDFQYFRTRKPEQVLSFFRYHQTLHAIKEDNHFLIFSGFANPFFDLQQIEKSTTLIVHENIKQKEIEQMAWADVLMSIFSSRLEAQGRAALYDFLKENAPKSILEKLFDYKLTLRKFSSYAGVQENTLRTNISHFRKNAE